MASKSFDAGKANQGELIMPIEDKLVQLSFVVLIM